MQVIYDPKAVSYERLLDVFFKKHDSTTLNRQGGDGTAFTFSSVLALQGKG